VEESAGKRYTKQWARADYMGQIRIKHVAGAHMGVALGSSQAASNFCVLVLRLGGNQR
jgi:hypothetical protein